MGDWGEPTYPFCSSSSRQMTMIPAKKSCVMMRMALPAPRSLTSPYMPDTTYATASPTVISTPSSFCAPFSSARSSFTALSTCVPAPEGGARVSANGEEGER